MDAAPDQKRNSAPGREAAENSSKMNALDLVVLIVIAFNGILGLVRGAVWQVFRLSSIVLGVWGAARYGRELLAHFPDSWGISPEVGIHVARIVVFLSIYLVMFGITNMTQALIKKIKLGGMDRTFGALLGATKGALFCCVLLYLQFWPLVSDIPLVHDQLQGSSDGRVPASRANRFFLEHVRERVNGLVPGEAKEKIEKLTQELDGAARKAEELGR